MDQILTAGWQQLAWTAHAPDVMLLQHRSGFVHPVFEHLDGLQLSEILGPLILPVERQGTQSNQGETQPYERPRGHSVKAGEEGRLAFHLTAAEGTLDQLQRPFPKVGGLGLLPPTCPSSRGALRPFRWAGW